MPLPHVVLVTLVLTFCVSRILGLAAPKHGGWRLRIAHLASWLSASTILLAFVLDWRNPTEWLGATILAGVCQLVWLAMDRHNGTTRDASSTWLVLTNLLVVGATTAGALLVGIQLRENWRQAQLAYLQQRGQDFLDREYAADGSLACLYDWWNARGPHDTTLPQSRTRCHAVMTNEVEYAKTMLYVEEVLMYFVEEARISCTNNVGYSRELEIWRNDVRDDVSGAFSYYMIYRFAAPEMHGYFMDAALRETTADAQLVRFVRMARLNSVALNDLCGNMKRFRSQLRIAGEPPTHVTNLCPEPIPQDVDGTSPGSAHAGQANALDLATDERNCDSTNEMIRLRACPIFDWEDLRDAAGIERYCREVHNRKKSAMDAFLDWILGTQNDGATLPS